MPRPAPLVDEVCRAFALGAPRAPWRDVDGGLSNALRRLETDRGVFAIKQMIAGTQRAEFQRNVEASFAIERAAVAADLPVPRPVVAGDACLARIACTDGSRCWVRVHEWVGGDRLTHAELTLGQADELGALIGRVHALDHPIDQTASEPPDYRELASHTALAPIAPAIAALAERLSAPGRLVPGHNDADDKNTLVADDRLLLLDWDAACPVDPAHELTALLLDWSGALVGEPRDDIARAIRAGYPRDVALDPSGWIDGHLGWLRFNLRRSLGHHGTAAIAAGHRELSYYFEHLPRIARSVDDWIARWR